MDNPARARLDLNSQAFANGQAIPSEYTCDGGDRTPAIEWNEPPAGTKGFALVVDDPDAPNGTFRHWGVFDIPASSRSIRGNQQVGSEVQNDFGKTGYSGPCPPKGNGLHHYHFKLFAVHTERLPLNPNAKVIDVENAARKHLLGEGELIGTYERS